MSGEVTPALKEKLDAIMAQVAIIAVEPRTTTELIIPLSDSLSEVNNDLDAAVRFQTDARVTDIGAALHGQDGFFETLVGSIAAGSNAIISDYPISPGHSYAVRQLVDEIRTIVTT